DFAAVDGGQKFFEQRSGRQRLQEGLQLFFLERLVSEWIFFCVGFQEKIERVDDRHVGNETDFEREFPCRTGKNEPRQKIAVRVLLPVDEVVFRFYSQRVTCHGRAAVRRRT